MSHIGVTELTAIVEQAVLRAGGDEPAARALAEATVQAEQAGKRAVGVGHLWDYLDGYRRGRITTASPALTKPAAAVHAIDARGGLVQRSFQEVQQGFIDTVRSLGLAALWVSNSYPCGELGYYPRALARAGLIGFAVANSPALMSVGGAPGKVLGTNPLAYAFPRADAKPMVIDQASSATAYVNVRRAAEAGQPIPEGWALNAAGDPTADPAAALEGTLLPFGGHKGGNIALFVELLATLAGANFSVTAPAFDEGSETPGTGLFLLGIDPSMFGGSVERLSALVERLQGEHGVSLPSFATADVPDILEIDDSALARLRAAATQ